jgi:hypothetical protein
VATVRWSSASVGLIPDSRSADRRQLHKNARFAGRFSLVRTEVILQGCRSSTVRLAAGDSRLPANGASCERGLPARWQRSRSAGASPISVRKPRVHFNRAWLPSSVLSRQAASSARDAASHGGGAFRDAVFPCAVGVRSTSWLGQHVEARCLELITNGIRHEAPPTGWCPGGPSRERPRCPRAPSPTRRPAWAVVPDRVGGRACARGRA